MSLYDRLIGIGDDPKIPVHQFMAAMAERQRGRTNNAQLASVFNLSAAEQQELATLRDRVLGGQVTPAEIHDVLMLAEAGMGYTTAQAVKTRLGV